MFRIIKIIVLSRHQFHFINQTRYKTIVHFSQSQDCLEENTHYKGGAIKRPGKKYLLKNIESAEACQLECQANAECLFFTWNSGTGPGRWNKRMKNTCWLKKEKKNVLKDCGKRCTGRVSGPKFC